MKLLYSGRNVNINNYRNCSVVAALDVGNGWINTKRAKMPHFHLGPSIKNCE